MEAEAEVEAGAEAEAGTEAEAGVPAEVQAEAEVAGRQGAREGPAIANEDRLELLKSLLVRGLISKELCEARQEHILKQMGL